MGLDMYLSVHHKIRDPYQVKIYSGIERGSTNQNSEGLSVIKTGITYEYAYWRKANAIHKFFVDHVADGVDDCKEVFVPLHALENLHYRCHYLILKEEGRLSELGDDNIPAEPRECEDYLPTCEGFFFGSTAYDEYYWNTLVYTEEKLRTLIKFLHSNRDRCAEQGGSMYYVYYQASW